MKKLIFFTLCLLLLSCKAKHDKYDPEEPEDCDCAEVPRLWEYPELSPEVTYWWPLSLPSQGVPKLDELQIPDTVLCCYSTEKLVNFSLQLPFVIRFSSGTWYSQERNYCLLYATGILYYNQISELFARSDAAYWLLKRYHEEIQLYLENGGFYPKIRGPKETYLTPLGIMLTNVNLRDDESLCKEILRTLVLGYEAGLTTGLSLDRKFHNDIDFFPNIWARAFFIDKICQCLPESFSFNGRIFTDIRWWEHPFIREEDYDLVNQLSYELIK